MLYELASLMRGFFVSRGEMTMVRDDPTKRNKHIGRLLCALA